MANEKDDLGGTQTDGKGNGTSKNSRELTKTKTATPSEDKLVQAKATSSESAIEDCVDKSVREHHIGLLFEDCAKVRYYQHRVYYINKT